MAEPEPEPIVEPTPEPGPIVELIVEPTPEPEPIVEPEPTPVSEPEPEQLPETDTSMWYWLVIAGIIGIIFLVLYNRRQKKCRECGAKLTQSEIDNDQKTCSKCKFDSN